MRVETREAEHHTKGEIPPRTFIEMSEAEVIEACRRYACDEGVSVPCGRPILTTTDGAPRASGFTLVVPHEAAVTFPLFDQR